MMLSRPILINPILMLFMLGDPAMVNIAMAQATNAPMPVNEIETSHRQKNRWETIPCSCAGEKSFRQITQAVPFQEFLSTNCFCICKLIDAALAGPERCLPEAIGKYVLWSSSAAIVDGAEMPKNPSFAKSCSYCVPGAPSSGPTLPMKMKVISVCETMQQAQVERTTNLGDGGTDALWLVSEEFYDRLRQRVGPLEVGSGGTGVRTFVDPLKRLETYEGIARHGYTRQAWS